MSWDFLWYDILPYVGLACLVATGVICVSLASILIKAKLDAWEARNQAAVRRMHERDAMKASAVAYAEELLRRYAKGERP